MALYFRNNVSANTLFFANAQASLVPTFGIDSITAGTIREGDTVTLQVSNANATGKTLAIPAGSLTVSAQDANSMSFVVPDLKTFGDQATGYETNITITASDAGVDSTITFQVASPVSYVHDTISALTGIYTKPEFAGVAIGDRVLGYWSTGAGLEDLSVGALSSEAGGVFTIWVQDDTDDVWGLAGSVTVPATSADTTAPVITLLGNASVSIEEGTTYNDAGATASDDVDGDITSDIVTTDPVDTSTPGTYTVRYNVQDAAGNDAVEVTRTVTVTAAVLPDTTAPVITLLGNASVSIEEGATYSDAGATALDDTDGDITSDIITTNPVDTSTPGTYTVRYNVQDAAGNSDIEALRGVTVNAVVVSPGTVDYFPSLLATNTHEVTVFKGRGNRFRVELFSDGEALDLSSFSRFELIGLTEQAIDSDNEPGVIDWDDGGGVINIDVGEIATASGSVKTTLIGYNAENTDGVVLWHPSLAQAHVTVNLINA